MELFISSAPTCLRCSHWKEQRESKSPRRPRSVSFSALQAAANYLTTAPFFPHIAVFHLGHSQAPALSRMSSYYRPYDRRSHDENDYARYGSRGYEDSYRSEAPRRDGSRWPIQNRNDTDNYNSRYDRVRPNDYRPDSPPRFPYGTRDMVPRLSRSPQRGLAARVNCNERNESKDSEEKDNKKNQLNGQGHDEEKAKKRKRKKSNSAKRAAARRCAEHKAKIAAEAVEAQVESSVAVESFSLRPEDTESEPTPRTSTPLPNSPLSQYILRIQVLKISLDLLQVQLDIERAKREMVSKIIMGCSEQ
ncbi:hypothetical protein IQ07DRAFT_157920 [Pyrenochaeta sp. DS3sAY3a]|nr:hypothetical protein IQ07DRAFT_157920 [Pyrenochaeta sp. DS3sAY3a]